MVWEAAKCVVPTLPREDVCADIIGAPSFEIFDNGQPNSRGKLDRRTLSAFGVVGVNAFRCAIPSTNWKTVLENPPSRRFALSAIASNTGCMSSGELAMTFNI